MVKVYRSTVLDAPAERVWRDLRDFNGLPNWHPSVALCRIENGHPADKVGCVRTYQLKDGSRFREKLLSLSDFDYTCTSAILDGPWELQDHVATMRFFPITEGNRCFAEWTAEFECSPDKEGRLTDAVAEDMIQTGFDALKKRYGQR